MIDQTGRHIWLREDFSVRVETLCMHAKTALKPGADYRKKDSRELTGQYCLRGRNHRGSHVWTMNPDVRDYAFNERKP